MHLLVIFVLVLASLLPISYVAGISEKSAYKRFRKDREEYYFVLTHEKSKKLLSSNGTASGDKYATITNLFQLVDKPNNDTLILPYPGLHTHDSSKPKCMDVYSGCFLNRPVTEYRCNEGKNQDFVFSYRNIYRSKFLISSACNSSWLLTVLPDGTQVLKENTDENYSDDDFNWNSHPTLAM